jgi:hypothetical protein
MYYWIYSYVLPVDTKQLNQDYIIFYVCVNYTQLIGYVRFRWFTLTVECAIQAGIDLLFSPRSCVILSHTFCIKFYWNLQLCCAWVFFTFREIMPRVFLSLLHRCTRFICKNIIFVKFCHSADGVFCSGAGPYVRDLMAEFKINSGVPIIQDNYWGLMFLVINNASFHLNLHVNIFK